MLRVTLPSRRVTGVLTIGALVLAGQVLASSVPAAAATTYTVSTTADTATNAGACGNSSITTAPSPLSLREATCLANNAGGSVQITVPAGTYNLSNGELQLGSASGQSATVAGAGAGSTVIDGGGLSRVFDLDFNLTGGVTTSISNLTITRGTDDTFGGAGIIGGSNSNTTADSLTLSNVVMTDNSANVASPSSTNRPGGAVQFLGGQLSIQNSTFNNNRSGSSYGSAIAYGANGVASPEGLSITGSTFGGNNVVNRSDATTGGALALFGTASSNVTVTDTRFVNNSASTQSGSGNAVGAAIWQQSGNLSVTRSTFTGNAVGGTGSPLGGAIKQSAGNLTLQYNRIVGNIAPSGAGSAVHASSAVTATQNWWGCNAGPGGSGCDTVAGSVTTSPRLVLAASASPATVTGPNATSTITGSLTSDSSGNIISGANLSAFAGLPVTFSDPPGDATVTTSSGPHSAAISSGTASIDYHSGTVTGSNPVNASFDNQTVTTSVTVNRAPSITSPNSANFAIGQAGSFTVTTTGYPDAAITQTGTLPTGLNFYDNGNGTATISGTPSGSGGSYPLSLTANNGVSPNATQTLTLTVGQAPAFTSPSTATFRIGQAGSFTVTTSGVPTVSTITESGALPAGLVFMDNGNGTATLSGTPTGTGATYPVTLTATNGVSPNGTQNLTVQVNQAPAVTSNPADQTVQPGTSVSFTAAASGVPTPSVLWQRSTDGGTSFVNIAGATATTYTFTAASADNGNEYRAVFTNSAGTATTTAATVSVGTAPAFTSANNTRMSVGQAGNFSVTTSGMPSAMLSRTGAQFPAWLALTDNGDGTGSLIGTPPAGSGGQYIFTLKAANGFSPSASQTFTLFVDQSPVITSVDHATFTAGQASAFTITTTAGYPTSTTLSKTGPLPGGITFTDNSDGTASLTGTPAVGSGGSYSFTIRADNGGTAADAVQSFTLTVREPPRITSTDHATFRVGTPGSFTVTTAAGNPASTTITTSGTLPSGVSFVDNSDGTATIAGTPNAGTGGVYTVSFTASNGIAPDAVQTFTLTVNEGTDITSVDHATFRKDAAAAFTVTTAGGQPSDVTLTESGALPSGVSFTDNGDGTATISGTSTTNGTYSITITASNGILPDRHQAFTLTVLSPVVVTSGNAATFHAGDAGSFTVTTNDGYPAATTITETGTLPSGVSFTDNGDGTATLAGTPAAHAGGSYPVTLTATNGVAPDSVQAFTLTVTEAPEFTSANSAAFGIGTNGSTTISATGYPTPSLSVTGPLPTGVTFVDNGDGTATLAGTPAAGTAGTYSLSIKADTGDDTATQAFTLTVGKKAQAITVQSVVPASPIVGGRYTLAATADSGLPVSFAVNAATTNAACAIVDGTVSLQHVGHCTIDYVQAGDTTWAAAQTLHDDFDVAAVATTTTLGSSKATTVYGEAATLKAHVAAGSVLPDGTVRFTVDGHTLGTPVPVNASGDAVSTTLADTDGTPLAPGSHSVTASFVPTDPSVYATSNDTDTQIVDKARTTSDLSVTSSSLSATVAPVAPGAGAPTGTVTFFVAGSSVGSATVTDGVATLTYAVPAGKSREVAASYSGDTSFSASSDSVTRQDPSITAKVTSKVKASKYGWYRTPVTITFSCTAAGAPLTTACPASVTLTHDAAGRSVSRTIAAADGGMSTVTVRGIDIDRTAPRVSVGGVRNGATYYGASPTVRCVGKDSLSGVATCRVKLTKSGITTRYRVTVTDRAGNTRSVTGSYRTSGLLLKGTSFTKGAWNVTAGRTYTIAAYAGSRPTYYDAAVYPRKPHQKDGAFRKAGTGRWAIGITMDRGMHAHKYWNLGVRIGKTIRTIKVRVR